MSALVREYSIEILKKINFELGNAIKIACDVVEPRGVGTEDSLRGQEQELLQVGGETQNTETNMQPGCSEPSLKLVSHVETCLGDQDGSRDDVVHGREDVITTLPVLVDEEALGDVEEEADKQFQVGNGPAQAYPGAGVSKSRYISISILMRYSNFSRFYKKLGPFYTKIQM